MDAIDARIAVHAADNTRELSGIDPSKLRLRQEAHGPVMERYMQRSASGELTWCVTAYPCEAFAQDAGMSLSQYEDFVFRSGWLHLADPVSAWKEFSAKLHQVKDKLAGVRELRVVAEDTDITVGVAGRTWIPADGDRNFPDGEVFTGPEESVTRGDVRFSYPAIFGGREVDDVRLRFEDGRVVKSEAGSGEGLLREMLAVDDGASVLGEFAIGTNYNVDRFTKQILFDEKIGGTFHMAVGAGYPETGSSNVSALHWDMVCDLRDGGEIYADGELIYSRRQVRARVLARPDAAAPPTAGSEPFGRAGWPASAIRATRSMNGRSWTRSTRTPAAAATATTAAVPSRFGLRQPERLRGHLLVRAGQQQRVAQPGQPVEGAQAVSRSVAVDLPKPRPGSSRIASRRTPAASAAAARSSSDSAIASTVIS